MASPSTQTYAVLLTTVMLFSVAISGIGAAASMNNDDTLSTSATTLQEEVNVQSGSAKALSLSWFRRAGDSTGPYPVTPTEYDGNESNGILMFTNAEGDAELRVDNSTARNANGKWDMVVLHVETSGLGALNPPTEGWDKGLVTQEFLDNSNWDLTIEQTNGNKVLDIAANQEGFEPPELNRHTAHEVPPVMIFADQDVIEDDYTVDEAPDTGLYVWIDPNRATLMEGGEEVSFEPGDRFEATFTIEGQSETTNFKMVDGDADVPSDLTAANTFGETVTARSRMSGGTMVQVVMVPENGANQSTIVEVEGNRELGGDTKGTIERGMINARFDFSGMAGQSFELYVYAPGYKDEPFTDEFRDQEVLLEPQNRILVGQGGGTVENVIDPDYTIPNATIRDSKTLTIANTNPDHDTPEGIATQVGDGHLSGDSTIAYNTEASPPYFDEMWLHYETSDEIFAAIRKSPGSSDVEKFLNSPLDLEVVQTNAEGSPKRLDLSRNASGVYVVPDQGQSDPRLYNSSETTGIFFSFKLNSMQFFQDGDPVMPEVGDRFAATFTINTSEGLREETTYFRIVEGKTVIVNQPGELAIPQSDAAEITWNSTLARGTAMGVRLVAESEGYDERSGEINLNGLGPSICCDGGNTNPWGSGSASFDTSNLPIGTEVTAQVMVVADLPGNYPDELVLAELSGQIVAPPSGEVSISDQSGDGSTVTVERVNLTRGGFVSIRTGSANGPLIGHSAFLEPGVTEDLEIELDQVLTETTTIYVTAHADTNRNQQFDFPVSDDPLEVEDQYVSASATYTVSGGDGTPTETTADDETTASDGDGDGGLIPGFGLGVALLGLIVAAYLARRD